MLLVGVGGLEDGGDVASRIIELGLGGFLLALGLAKASPSAKAEPGFLLESVGVAVLNTIMLVAAVQGITQVTT